MLGCAGGNSAEALRLDPKANPAAAEILANPPPDSGSEVLGSINMMLLLRSDPQCCPAHSSLDFLTIAVILILNLPHLAGLHYYTTVANTSWAACRVFNSSCANQ